MKMRQAVTWGVLIAVVVVGTVFWLYNRRNSEGKILARGQIAFQKGDLNQAADLFEEAHRRYPDSFLAARWLATTEIRLGRTDEARRHAEAAAKINPGSVEPHLLRSAAFRADAGKKYAALVRTPVETEFFSAEALCAQAFKAVEDAEALGDRENADVLAERGHCHHLLFRLNGLHERTLRSEAARLQGTDAGQAADLRKRADEYARRTAAEGEAGLASFLASLRKNGKNAVAAESAEDLAMSLGRSDAVLDVYDLLARSNAATERATLTAVQSLMNRAASPVTADDWKASQRAIDILEAFLKTHPKSADARVYLARVLLARGDATAAAAQVDRILEINPSSPWGRMLKGQLLLASGQPEKAKELIQPLGQTIPDSIAYKLLMAEVQRKTGYPQMERQLYKEVLDLDPTNADARIALLRAMLAEGQEAEADAQIAAALTAAPESEPILRFAVQYYLDRGRDKEAIDLLDRTARRPNPPRGLRELVADLYLQAGLVDRAEETIRQIGLGQDAGDVRQQLVVAGLALARGRVDEARKMFEDVVAANPRWAQGHLALARTLAMQGLGEDAAREAARAVESDPRDPTVRLAAAQVYANVGQLDEAETICEGLLRDAPSNAAALRLAARIDLLRQDYDRAGSRLEALNRLQGSPAQDWLIQAQLAYQQGRFDKCVEICSDKNDPDALSLAAAALMRQGKAEDAARQLVRLIETRPDCGGQVYDQLVRIWLSFDTPAGALERLNGLKNARPLPLALSRGMILAQMGKFDDAMKIYTDLLADARFSSNAAAQRALRNALAVCCRMKDDSAGELKHYEALTSNRDTGVSGWLSIYQFHRRAGRTDRAVEALDRLSREIGDDDTAVTTRRQLALHYAEIGRTDKAVAELNRAIAARPDTPQLVQDKVQVLLTGGKADDALNAVNDALRRWPDNVQMLGTLAAVQAARREYEAALDTFDRMTRLGETARLVAAYDRAVLFVRLGLYSEAVAGLRSLLSGLPATGRPYVLTIAQALIGLGQHAEAQAELAKVPESSPHYRAARLMLARDLRQTGKTDDAIAVYQSLLAARADDGEVAYELCDALAAARRMDEATKVAEAQVAKTAPRTRQAVTWRIALAGLAAKKRDWPAAIAALRDVVAVFPDRSEFRWQLALYHLAAGDNQAAAAELAKEPPASLLAQVVRPLAERTASAPASQPASLVEYIRNPRGQEGLQLACVLTMLAVNPDPKPILELLQGAAGEKALAELIRVYAGSPSASRPQAGQVCRLLVQSLAAHMTGQAWLADYFCEQANQLDPDSPLVPIVWAPLLNALGKRNEAARVGDAAMAVYGKTRWGVELGIWKALAAGDYDGAVRQINEAEAGSTIGVSLLTAGGDAFMRQNRLDEALKWFERALAAQPDNADANNNVAYLLAEVHDGDAAALERAQQLAEKAVAAAPAHAGARDTLGWVRLKRGDAKGALPELLAALETLGNDPRMQYHIGLCYHKLGQDEMARLHLANVGRLAGAAEFRETKLAAELLAKLPPNTRPVTTTSAPAKR